MPTIEIRGRRVAFEQRPGKREPLVFVHGWACAKWAFEPQIEHFSKAGHAVAAVDLPGHGESGPIQAPVDISDFAEAVGAVIREAGFEAATVVGHSMGGITALALAAASPEQVRAVVAVDPAPTVVPFREIPAFADAEAALHSDAWLDFFRGFIESQFFHPTTKPALRAQVIREMTSRPRETVVGCWEAMGRFDGTKVGPDVARPVLHIAAEPPLNPPHLLAELLPDCTSGWTVGGGHFNQLEVPEQVNSMIGHFLAALAARDAG